MTCASKAPALLALPLLVLQGREAGAQSSSGQIWANFTMEHSRAESILVGLDLEPKVQVSGSDGWNGVDITPSFEYSLNRWAEAVGELALSRTRQTNDVRSWEATPRVGLRVHLLNNLRTMLPGRRPLGRIGIANLSRWEWRNLWYSDGTPASRTSRFRNRVELKVGLNHEDVSLDHTLYAVLDFEIFVPFGDDVPERFAAKRRTRAGLGYRRDARWRFELLYIRDGTRQATEETFATSANIVNFKVKAFF